MQDYTPPFPPRYNTYKPGDHISWWKFPLFMYRYSKNPVSVFSEYHFEKPFWNSSLGNINFYMISSPDIVRDILVKKADIFKFDPIRKRVLQNLAGDSLLTVEGQDWKRARQVVAPIFNPRIVGTLAQTMRQTCEKQAEIIASSKQTIMMNDSMAALAYEILADTLFSGDLQGDSDQMRQDLEKVISTTGVISVLDIFNVPSWVPRPSQIRIRSALKRFRSLVLSNIAHRRSIKDAIEKSDNNSFKTDLLDMMIKARSEDGAVLSDQEIEDNLLAFIGAGHETTARALSWTLYILSQCTHWRDKLEAEIDAAGLDELPADQWGNALPITKAIIEESMRLYPPVPLMVRRANKASHIAEEACNEGTVAIIWSFIMHRHKTLWSEPDIFRPERFLPENRDKIDRFAYLPFGAGPRFCVGMTFAMQEAVIALACLTRKLRFNYAGEEPPMPLMRITLRPHNGMPMTVERRMSN